MAQKAFVQTNFSGGWSTDKKLGIAHSFADSQSIDFRKKPSQFSVLPGPTKDDGGGVDDLIQNIIMTNDGTIYGIGSAGSFYRRTSAGVWSTVSQMQAGTFGIDYRQDADAIYITGNKSVSLYNPVSNSPSMKPAFYAESFSTYNNSDWAGFNVNSYQIDGTAITTIGTSYTETSGLARYFQSDIEPLKYIQVFIKDKGTGDWTLTLHDGLNNTLGTSTVDNADLVSNDWNSFSFPDATNDQIRLYVKPNARTYHYHLTSTVADGTITSLTPNNLGDCNQKIFADRMVQTTNGMHPMIRFMQYECIGNGNYLSVWEPLSDPPTNDEWLRHKLVFPQEYEVCGVAVFNEYLAIACERVTTGDQTPQDGIIFFWDGLSSSYNYLTKIPEGSPYSIHEYKNVIYYYAGGSWYAISSPASQPVKIRTMPNTDTEYSGGDQQIVVNPYCATVRKGIHLMGFPSTTSNEDIKYGVYSWGAVDKNFSESFGYSYALSTGSQYYTAQNNLTIGMVKSFGSELFVSWRDDDNGGYGIDLIDNSSQPASSAYWESLIFDNGFPGKEKTGAYVQAVFASLPTDCSFQLKYSINRGDWVYSEVMTSATLIYPGVARFDISENGNRFYEIQIGIDLTLGDTTPEIIQMAMPFEDNAGEGLIS